MAAVSRKDAATTSARLSLGGSATFRDLAGALVACAGIRRISREARWSAPPGPSAQSRRCFDEMSEARGHNAGRLVIHRLRRCLAAQRGLWRDGLGGQPGRAELRRFGCDRRGQRRADRGVRRWGWPVHGWLGRGHRVGARHDDRDRPSRLSLRRDDGYDCLLERDRSLATGGNPGEPRGSVRGERCRVRRERLGGARHPETDPQNPRYGARTRQHCARARSRRGGIAHAERGGIGPDSGHGGRRGGVVRGCGFRLRSDVEPRALPHRVSVAAADRVRGEHHDQLRQHDAGGAGADGALFLRRRGDLRVGELRRPLHRMREHLRDGRESHSAEPGGKLDGSRQRGSHGNPSHRSGAGCAIAPLRAQRRARPVRLSSGRPLAGSWSGPSATWRSGFLRLCPTTRLWSRWQRYPRMPPPWRAGAGAHGHEGGALSDRAEPTGEPRAPISGVERRACRVPGAARGIHRARGSAGGGPHGAGGEPAPGRPGHGVPVLGERLPRAREAPCETRAIAGTSPPVAMCRRSAGASCSPAVPPWTAWSCTRASTR